MTPEWIQEIKWTRHGLVPAVIQDADQGDVLMLAWMNREALESTLRDGWATYWSRSRGALWRKGERSGNGQRVREMRLDCDGDTVLLRVDQEGGIACHTGRRACFYRRLNAGRWENVDPVLRDPAEIYDTEP